jgi:UDP-N-acetylmuramate-alanine ligase
MRIGQAVTKTVTVGKGKKQHEVKLYGSVIAVNDNSVEVQLTGKQALVQEWDRGECHKIHDASLAHAIAEETGYSKDQAVAA